MHRRSTYIENRTNISNRSHSPGAFYILQPLVFATSLLSLVSPIRNHSGIHRKTICAAHHAYHKALHVSGSRSDPENRIRCQTSLRIGFGLRPQHFPSIVAFKAWRNCESRSPSSGHDGTVANFPLNHISILKSPCWLIFAVR